MLRFLPILYLLLASSGAQAEDVRWKSEAFRAGDYTTLDQSQGGLIHHVFRGKSSGLFVVDSFRGAKPGGTPVFRTFMDRDGNQVRWLRSDGFELRFAPHDCTRTLGRCQYTQTASDGARQVRLRITRATSRGLAFEEFSADGKRLLTGKIDLDERGNAGSGTVKGSQGVQRFKLIQTFYQ